MADFGNINWQPNDLEARIKGAIGRLGDRFKGARIIVVLVLLLIVGRLLIGSIVIVPAGHRAVVFSKFSGVLKETSLGEGFHVLIPWVWSAERYNVRQNTWTVTVGEPEPGQSDKGDSDLVALTKDGQKVTLDVSVQYHPDPKNVWRLHQLVGPRYRDKIIRPQVRSICRMVVSQYAVTDVYSSAREAIQERISTELGDSMGEWDIVLDQLLLRHVMFDESFQQAVEAKQVAIQEFERMEYELQTAEKNRQQKVIEAEGEAESLRLQGNALRDNPLAMNYEYARKVAPAVRGVITGKATTPPAAPAGGR